MLILFIEYTINPEAILLSNLSGEIKEGLNWIII